MGSERLVASSLILCASISLSLTYTHKYTILYSYSLCPPRIRKAWRMPNKTIYVSDADLPIFERAQQLAGDNLSATIAQALRQYVESRERRVRGFREVTVKVGKQVYSHKRFMARLLAKGRFRGSTRYEVFEVYETRKGKIALYVRNVPSWWYAGRGESFDQGEAHDWADWRGEYALEIYDKLEEMKERVPEELYQAAEQALNGDVAEVLDI
jgi:EXLDI family protein